MFGHDVHVRSGGQLPYVWTTCATASPERLSDNSRYIRIFAYGEREPFGSDSTKALEIKLSSTTTYWLYAGSFFSFGRFSSEKAPTYGESDSLGLVNAIDCGVADQLVRFVIDNHIFIRFLLSVVLRWTGR